MLDTLISLLQSSGGSVIINKKLMRAVGINSALVFAELCSKYTYWKNREQLTSDGFFFCTSEDLEEATTLSSYLQKQAIDSLVELGMIEYKVVGLPAKRHYKIACTAEQLVAVLENKISKNSNSSSKKIQELDIKEFDTNNNINNNNKTNNNTSKEVSTGCLLPKDCFSTDISLVENKNKTKEKPQQNHLAVRRYLAKIEGKEILPYNTFTNTDWLIAFVLAYNDVFKEEMILPPMGAQFNSLIFPFSQLIETIPIHDRLTVFDKFLNIVKNERSMPQDWAKGFTINQLMSYYNLEDVRKEFKRLAECIHVVRERANTAESIKQGIVYQVF